MPSANVTARSKAYTEQKLRKVTIGTLTPLNAPVRLVPYDPTWPRQFRREAKRIREALGTRAVRIEHVGSTSVPGLTAKPIIDILLVVGDSPDEPSYVPMLEAAGYVLRIREPDWKQHRLFKGPDREINLHVFSEGSDEIERLLTFRDRLRENRSDFDLYARTKARLAHRKWHYTQDYADAKSKVVETILARAWSRTADAVPGPAPNAPTVREARSPFTDLEAPWSRVRAERAPPVLALLRAVIARVPRGKVITYGQVAEAAGFPRAARLTVWALQRGSELPWHRVVAAGGRIALPGEEGREQRLRLEVEGVAFRGDRVRMDRHNWVPRRSVKAGPTGAKRKINPGGPARHPPRLR